MIKKDFFKKYAIYILLAFEIALFALVSDVFLTPTNLFNVLRQVSVVGIISVGMTFVILTGGIDLSVGGIVAVSGVLAAKMMIMGLPIVVAVAGSIVMGAAVGVVNAFFSHEFELNPMIVTLATMTILKGVSYIITGGIPLFGFPESFKFFGQGHLGFLPIPVIIMVIAFVIAGFILKNTKFGLRVYSIGGNEEASRLSGTNIRRVKYTNYIISGVLAAIAGLVLLSRVNTAQPGAGLGYEMDVITGVVLGGVSMSGGEGKIYGVLAGVLAIGILSNGMLQMGISEYFQWIVKGGVMLFAISYDKIIQLRKRA